MHVVYGLQDPRDNGVFYVGLTGDLYARYLQHIKCDGNNAAKNERIHQLKTLGFLPIPLTLEVTHIQAEAQERELYWIAHYRRLGMPLCNVIRETPPVKRETPPVKIITATSLAAEDALDKAVNAWRAGATGPREMERVLGVTYYQARKLCQEIVRQGLTGA